MDYTILIFISLFGAAALGFISAWTIQWLKLKEAKQEQQELAAELKDQEFAYNRLKAENEAQAVSVTNMQHLLQDIENQSFTSEKLLAQLKNEHQQLQKAYQELLEHPLEKIREIEVIREVPVLVFRERQVEENKWEKAKKLVKAFKKGYLHENEKVMPPEQ